MRQASACRRGGVQTEEVSDVSSGSEAAKQSNSTIHTMCYTWKQKHAVTHSCMHHTHKHCTNTQLHKDTLRGVNCSKRQEGQPAAMCVCGSV